MIIKKPGHKIQKVLDLEEASSHDRIKMTELWLEYDQKISQQQTLILEHCMYKIL